jgi:hypothetical protein
MIPKVAEFSDSVMPKVKGAAPSHRRPVISSGCVPTAGAWRLGTRAYGRCEGFPRRVALHHCGENIESLGNAAKAIIASPAPWNDGV